MIAEAVKTTVGETAKARHAGGEWPQPAALAFVKHPRGVILCSCLAGAVGTNRLLRVLVPAQDSLREMTAGCFVKFKIRWREEMGRCCYAADY